MKTGAYSLQVPKAMALVPGRRLRNSVPGVAQTPCGFVELLRGWHTTEAVFHEPVRYRSASVSFILVSLKCAHAVISTVGTYGYRDNTAYAFPKGRRATLNDTGRVLAPTSGYELHLTLIEPEQVIGFCGLAFPMSRCG